MGTKIVCLQLDCGLVVAKWLVYIHRPFINMEQLSPHHHNVSYSVCLSKYACVVVSEVVFCFVNTGFEHLGANVKVYAS